MLTLTRPPTTPNELHALIQAMWGINIPRKNHCPNHNSPFNAFCEGYFGNKSNWVLWYGSRGTGKSLMLAILAITKSALLGTNTTLLGGSMAQSQNVHEHIENLMLTPNAPRNAVARQIQTELAFKEGNWIRPLPASQRTVRGPHPNMVCLDEIDEMDWDVYNAAQGQAMARPNIRGHIIPEMTVASSTWQRPAGTFEKVLRNAERNNLSIKTWCYKDILAPNGWMDPAFIERKKLSVPSEMFRVEYELGEPSGQSRAFDVASIENTFTTYPSGTITHTEKPDDDTWTFEKPDKHGWYAAGVDWAKSVDKTVIVVLRIDVNPWQIVHIRKLGRRPWPWMIDQFNKTITHYNAVSAHDATGLGNVVHDLVDERTLKVVMVGKDRIELLTEYITAVEKGAYNLPRQVDWYYQDHRACNVEEVFAPGKWNSHLADSIAAAAIAHRAAARQTQPIYGQIVKGDPKDPPMLKWQKAVDLPPPPESGVVSREGDVVELEEHSEVGVFWM